MYTPHPHPAYPPPLPTRRFVFTTDQKGTVTLVHCHPEDHEELLTIKKAMVSVFSVHVKVCGYNYYR